MFYLQHACYVDQYNQNQSTEYKYNFTVGKKATIVVPNLGVRVIGEDKGFYHNFMSENGVRIICRCGLSPEEYDSLG